MKRLLRTTAVGLGLFGIVAATATTTLAYPSVCRGGYVGPYLYSWLSYSTGGAITSDDFAKADRNGNGLVCLASDAYTTGNFRLQDDHSGTY